MMPDNWSFVAAAYAVTAFALAGYWRRLRRRDRELAARESDLARRGRRSGRADLAPR